ncbi:MAG: hypothetical protein J3Q66DRAFT_351280 [Benniella sp.]|nr:MAG: hypothetical protein J3Q66DRAFT_351280 [Benniella sp.]
MSSITVSPASSSSSKIPMKRKLAVHPKPSPAKKNKRYGFTPQQETYIAEQIMDPAVYVSCNGPDTNYTGQKLHSKFFQAFTKHFNERFHTSLAVRTLKAKFERMKRKWRTTHEKKSSMMSGSVRLSPSKMQDQIKKLCHYFFILDPALVTTLEVTETRTHGTSGRSITTTSISDNDSDEHDNNRLYDSQTRSGTEGPRTFTTPVGKSHQERPVKRMKSHMFTALQEAYIAEQIMDPAIFTALYGSTAKYNGQHLHARFYKKLAEMFNKRFNTSLCDISLESKLNDMKMQWRITHLMRSSMGGNNDMTPPELQNKIMKHCHYYFILEPALATTKRATEKRSIGAPERTAINSLSDTDDGGDDSDEEEEEEEGVHGCQGRSSAGRQSISAILAEKSPVQQPRKNKGEALEAESPSDEMDLLGMLKDIKDTSMLQYEAEKEQTRREQLQLEERSRSQQENIRLEQLRVEVASLHAEESRSREEGITKREQLRFEEARMREEELTKREQLHFEEARLRFDETKLREEETTKREAIRIEVEKLKEQARMKELDIEHTTKLLLLEETRLKRAMAEKENLERLKTREGSK